jgi:aryl-alcohol dehydrogenase (NADP+)
VVAIGNSDLDIFPLALGGNTFGWTSDEPTSFEILDAFAAGGGNFVDTADSYSAFAEGNSGGESETVLGNWMASRGNRDHMVIATKVSQHPEFKGLAPANVRAAAEASLKRLQTGHIDVYYAHFDDADTPLVDTLGAFDELVRDGLVRHVALSNYSPERIREWLSLTAENGFAAPIALQPHYNLVHRHDYEPEVAAIATENGLGVFPYYSLAAGFLAGKYRTQADLDGQPRQRMATRYFSESGLAVVDALAEIADTHSAEISTIALAWLLTRPGITAPIASASRLEQLPALLDAPTVTLTASEISRLTTLSDAIGA